MERDFMTDEQIGKIVREITDHGLNAIVKKNKGDIIILKEKCEIVASEKEQ